MTSNNSSWRCVAVLAVAHLMLAAMTVEAQSSRSFRGRGGWRFRARTEGLVFLAGMTKVQKELKITSEQRELLETLQADLNDQRFGIFRRGREPDDIPGEGRDRLAQMQDQMRELTRLGDRLVATILEPPQTERLRQLHFQRVGLVGLKPDELTELSLSEPQLAEIDAIRREDPGDRGSQRVDTGDSTSREDVSTKVLALLSDDQRKKWDEMTGPEFTFPERQRYGRRGSAGRRGRQRRPQRPDLEE